MRKWGFSAAEGRFVLRVRLRDPSGRVDADFAEAELARLLGGPSRELREVDAGVKAAREAALQTAISKYEGVLTLRAGAARPEIAEARGPRGPRRRGARGAPARRVARVRAGRWCCVPSTAMFVFFCRQC